MITLAALGAFFVFYRQRTAMIVALALLAFAGGSYLAAKKIDRIASFDNAPEQLDFSGQGTVIAEPRIKEKDQELVFRPDDRDSNILIQDGRYQEHAYGEVLQLDCPLKRPKNPDGFDYRKYLARQDIFYVCQKPQMVLTGENRGNRFYGAVVAVKNIFSAKIATLIPAPEAGLLEGLIIGGDGKLSQELQDAFSRTGMTHIVAVSGYNITIVAQYLMLLGLFIGLWRRQAFWFALTGIWIFILMTGFPASAIRAGVMGTLLLYAMRNGRLANAGNAIVFSAAVMLAWNPLLLRYDVGFQLSFLATLGIVYCYPLLDGLFGKKLEKYPAAAAFIAEILFMSLSAQILVLPIILFNFQTLSLVSPATNILVLPILPLTMLIGFAAVLIGFILPPLAALVSWLAYLPLHYEVLVIKYFSSLHYAALTAGLSWSWMVVWYTGIVGVIHSVRYKILSKAYQ